MSCICVACVTLKTNNCSSFSLYCCAPGIQRPRTVSDVLVKETPVKKQVQDYRRFKLERLRYAALLGYEL